MYCRHVLCDYSFSFIVNELPTPQGYQELFKNKIILSSINIYWVIARCEMGNTDEVKNTMSVPLK